jgi:hypothetical protein
VLCYSDEEMKREYGPDERMLFATGGYFAMNALDAFRMKAGLVTLLPQTGTYRRSCFYITDEGPLISAALAARPERPPAYEQTSGNRLRQ